MLIKKWGQFGVFNMDMDKNDALVKIANFPERINSRLDESDL
jgi:hypothetical protein